MKRLRKLTIEQWMCRARRVMSECPKGYWLFAANGNLHVMQKVNGDRVINDKEGVDPELSVGTIAGRGMKGPDIDGGDW